jgi:hypothetical protein
VIILSISLTCKIMWFGNILLNFKAWAFMSVSTGVYACIVCVCVCVCVHACACLCNTTQFVVHYNFFLKVVKLI